MLCYILCTQLQIASNTWYSMPLNMLTIDVHCWPFHRMGLLHSMLPARRAILRLLSCYYKQELVWSRRQRWGGGSVKFSLWYWTVHTYVVKVLGMPCIHVQTLIYSTRCGCKQSSRVHIFYIHVIGCIYPTYTVNCTVDHATIVWLLYSFCIKGAYEQLLVINSM